MLESAGDLGSRDPACHFPRIVGRLSHRLVLSPYHLLFAQFARSNEANRDEHCDNGGENHQDERALPCRESDRHNDTDHAESNFSPALCPSWTGRFHDHIIAIACGLRMLRMLHEHSCREKAIARFELQSGDSERYQDLSTTTPDADIMALWTRPELASS